MSIVEQFLTMTIGVWIVFSGILLVSMADNDKSPTDEHVEQGVQWNEIE